VEEFGLWFGNLRGRSRGVAGWRGLGSDEEKRIVEYPVNKPGCTRGVTL